MSKKHDLIAKILSKLSEEELEELLSDDEEEIEEQEPEQVEEPASGAHVINSGRTDTRRQKNNKKKSGRRSGRGRQSKGRACRVMPMDIVENRPNKFEEILKANDLSVAEREELSIAEQADKKAESLPRMNKQSRSNSLVEVECCICGYEDDVPASTVYNINRWKCNDCSCQPGF